MSISSNNILIKKNISFIETPHYKLEEYNINNNGDKQGLFKLIDKNTNTTYLLNENGKQMMDTFIKDWSSANKLPCKKNELHPNVFKRGGKNKTKKKSKSKKAKNCQKKGTYKYRKGGRRANVNDFDKFITDYGKKYLIENPTELDYIDAFGKDNGSEYFHKHPNKYYIIKLPMPEEYIDKINCSNSISQNDKKELIDGDYIITFDRDNCGDNPNTIHCEGDMITKRRLTKVLNEYNIYSKAKNIASINCLERKGQAPTPTSITDIFSDNENKNVNNSRNSLTKSFRYIDNDPMMMFSGGCPACAAALLSGGNKRYIKKRSRKKKKKAGTKTKRKHVHFNENPVSDETGTYSDTEFDIDPEDLPENRMLIMQESRIPDFKSYFHTEDDNPYSDIQQLHEYAENIHKNRGPYKKMNRVDIIDDLNFQNYTIKKQEIENIISLLKKKYHGKSNIDYLIERDLRDNDIFKDDTEAQFIITSIYQPDVIQNISNSSDDEDIVEIHTPPVKKKRK